jgi:hypothetical protein
MGNKQPKCAVSSMSLIAHIGVPFGGRRGREKPVGGQVECAGRADGARRVHAAARMGTIYIGNRPQIDRKYIRWGHHSRGNHVITLNRVGN